jgi:hypothetical protein
MKKKKAASSISKTIPEVVNSTDQYKMVFESQPS